MDFCRSIPDEKLAEKLVENLKKLNTRTLEQVGKNLEIIVAQHFLSEKLEIKEIDAKKPKI